MTMIFSAMLFVASPSPGRVFQFLSRRAGITPERAERLASLDLRLSDGVGDESFRALVPAHANIKNAVPFFQGVAPLLATAFPPRVTLLTVAVNRWEYTVWQNEGETLEGGEDVAEIPFWSPRRFSSAPKDAPDAARLWAQSRGLPIARVPGFAKKPVPTVEYVTVTGLDQRGLLVETTPRLYTFDW